MQDDLVERVARAIWEAPINQPSGLRERTWPPQHGHVRQECRRQARAAMAATREIDANILKRWNKIDADWLQQRANAVRGPTDDQ